MSTIILIDANSIIHRAFHAVPPLKSSSGQVVNAVYGFASFLIHIFANLRPTHAAAAFDRREKTFRHDAFAEYKATRVKAPQELYDQIPLIQELLVAFSIPFFEKAGFEADDLLGTIAKKASEGRSGKVVIVTSDLDALQLVNANTFVASPRKGFSEITLYDSASVREKLGVTPEQVIDFKALKGDASDNIPGVRGIGGKGAAELLSRYETLDTIYDRLDDIRAGLRTKLLDGRDLAYLSRSLAIIDVNAPIEFDFDRCSVCDIHSTRISEFLRKFQFFSLLKRIGQEENIRQKTTQPALF